ncbi:rho guanine nucleotide exchange factor [Nesidiocoris tenuis]|uniref:Rho guanine nucleotide exchange factor n=1 Tax=Nesidiocoris tenuis TaxID=355587 RepID=A0ABN7AIM9_9HEMI|nr:rho guanine nucleotide exchange factor [Nesidiocoris tenuis]
MFDGVPLRGCSPDTVLQLLEPLASEFGVSGWPEVRLAGSQAEVDPEADVSLLEAEILIVDTPPLPTITGDRLKDLSIQWLEEEKKHVSRMRTCVPLYGSPLTNLGVLAPAEFSKICQPMAALAETCHAAITLMKELLDNWELGRSRLGEVFDEKLWNQYSTYQDSYRFAMQLIRDKSRNDDDFSELCKIRRGAAKYGLHDLLNLPVSILTKP